MKRLPYLLLLLALATSCKKEKEYTMTLNITGDRVRVWSSGAVNYTGVVLTRRQETAIVKPGDVVSVRAGRMPVDSTLVQGQYVYDYGMATTLSISATLQGYTLGPLVSTGSPVVPDTIVFYYEVPEY